VSEIVLPNVRKLFIPDPGYTMYDCDLSGADAQVVAWEAEDDDLKTAFRAGVDIHDYNAEAMLGTAYTQLAGDKDHGPKSRKRKEYKQGIHLTNYGGTPRAIAMVLGWTIHEGDRFQKRWFSIHPGIRDNFQGRVKDDLQRTRTVRNKFGFHRVYFDRIETCFTEALAWKPQSTVALVTYFGAFQLEKEFPQAQVLLQDHDNLVWQIPTPIEPEDEKIASTLSVVIPYDDPLVIPWGVSKSTKSWGDCV
jgi:DNA polymerase I-like protein with 3'-5' exonuclease and polymerase domains